MPNELDFENFGKNLEAGLLKKLEEHPGTLCSQAFDDDPYGCKRYEMECALRQHSAIEGGFNGYAKKSGISNTELMEYLNIKLPPSYEQFIKSRDEFSGLTTPILLKAHRTLFEIITNICFPLDDDAVGISRSNDLFFEESGLSDFLPAVNACLQNMLQTEDQQLGFLQEYESILQEGLAHGFWAVDHEFDPLHSTVRPFNPNTRQVAIYPQRSDWKRSNIVRYFDVEYTALLGNKEFNQELVEALKPNTDLYDNYTNNRRSTDYDPTTTNRDVPLNKVRVYKIICPSLTVVHEDVLYHAPGVVVYGLIKPEFLKNVETEQKSFYILSIKKDLTRLETGIHLQHVVPPNGDEFYNEGLFYPFLHHQRVANGLFAAVTRMIAMTSQSPVVKETNVFGAIYDEEETDNEGITPFKTMRGKCYPYFDSSLIATAPSIFQAIATLEQQVLQGIGVNPTMQGVANAGRRTAAEMLRVSASGDVKPMRIASRFIKGILIPSRYARLNEKIAMLKAEIEGLIEEVNKLNADLEAPQLSEQEILELILGKSEIFRQMLALTGLDVEYERFYRKRQRQLLDNQEIINRQTALAEQVKSLTELSVSEIPPFDPSQVSPQTVTNEQGIPMGVVPPTPEVIKQFEMQYAQAEMQKREQAKQEAERLKLDIQSMTLSIESINEIPEASNSLYYQILTAPLAEGDLRFAGAFAVFNKLAENGTLDSLVKFMSVLPPDEINKIDFEKFLTLIMRGENIRPTEILKDMDRLEREKDAQRSQAEYERQKTAIILQNPGSTAFDPERGGGR